MDTSTAMLMLMGPPSSSAELDWTPHPYHPQPHPPAHAHFTHGHRHSPSLAAAASGDHQIHRYARAAAADAGQPPVNINRIVPQPSLAYLHAPDWYGWWAAPPLGLPAPQPLPLLPHHLPGHRSHTWMDPRTLIKGGGPSWHPPDGMCLGIECVYRPAPPRWGPWSDAEPGTRPSAIAGTRSTAMNRSDGPSWGPAPARGTTAGSSALHVRNAGDAALDAPPCPSAGDRGPPRTASTTRFRGPPRKPRRSGHTLWVGNLPPSMQILTLRDFFATGLDAAEDLESVFFMSRSNCAFVNYRSEAACVEAADRFRGANCHGNIVTCRVRKALPVGSSSSSPSSSSSSGVGPSGPTARISPEPVSPPRADSPASTDASHAPVIVSSTPVTRHHPTGSVGSMAPSHPPHRFFILKSLTNDDLDWSVRHGLWATQSHNERHLNEAFMTSANVYLIFSTNKSGYFYGYARMTSPIADRASSASTSPVHEPFSPEIRVIATPGTSHVPAGRIVDDSVRGTLYWEMMAPTPEEMVPPGSPASGDASSLDGDDSSPSIRTTSGSSVTHVIASTRPTSVASSGGISTVDDATDGGCGRPFELTWLCTDPLPFIKTRGLQNPYNANKDVKVARDGTEIEASVGAHLLSLFAVG